MSFYMSYSSLS